MCILIYSRLQRQYVHMDTRKERHLTDLLTTIRTMEMVEPQSTCSYRDPFDDGEAAFEGDAEPIRDSKDAMHADVVEPTGDGRMPGMSYERYVYVDGESSHERQVSVKTETSGHVSVKIETSNGRYAPVKTRTSGHVRVKTETSGRVRVKTETDGFIPLEAKAPRRNSMDDASTSWRSATEVKSETSLASTSDAIDVDDSDSDEDDDDDVTEACDSLPKSEAVGDDDDDDDDDGDVNPVSTSVSELYQRAIQLIDDADNPFMSEFLLHRHARNRSYENLSGQCSRLALFSTQFLLQTGRG